MPTRNEFGVKLDKNGYAPSLFAHESFRCYHCHRFGDTARHEIYGGSRRKASKALGLWINVCPACHAAIHSSGELKDRYHRKGQLLAEAYYHGTMTTSAAAFTKTIWRTNPC